MSIASEKIKEKLSLKKEKTPFFFSFILKQSSQVGGIPEKTFIPSTQHALACLGISIPDRNRQHDLVTASWDPRTARAPTLPAAAPHESATPQGCHAGTEHRVILVIKATLRQSTSQSLPLDHSSFQASSHLNHGFCGPALTWQTPRLSGEEEGREGHRPWSKRFPRS